MYAWIVDWEAIRSKYTDAEYPSFGIEISCAGVPTVTDYEPKTAESVDWLAIGTFVPFARFIVWAGPLNFLGTTCELRG